MVHKVGLQWSLEEDLCAGDQKDSADGQRPGLTAVPHVRLKSLPWKLGDGGQGEVETGALGKKQQGTLLLPFSLFYAGYKTIAQWYSFPGWGFCLQKIHSVIARRMLIQSARHFLLKLIQ